MKSALLSILTLSIFSTMCIAQETRKTDDALLLEYYQSSRFAEAFAYLKTVYPEPVTNSKELLRLAYTASMSNKLPEAEAFYQRVYDRDTTDKTSLYNMAIINQRRGNTPRAEAFYKKYNLLDSTNFAVLKQLANIRASKNDTLRAIYYFEKANKIDSTEFDVASDLSDRYVQLKKYPEAEKVLQIALAADPENLILLRSLLILTSEQKKWPLAIKTGERLLQAGENSGFVVTKLGKAYYYAKNYRCGIETLLGLAEAFQTETTAYYTALCYKQSKDPKNAIVYFEKAVKLSISSATNAYYSEMGDSYETRGQNDRALAAYQKALLYDEYPLTYYYLANLYDQKLKDPKNALKYFKKYVALKPDPDENKEYISYSKSRIERLTAEKSIHSSAAR